jgi:Tol biopolymer transport system component
MIRATLVLVMAGIVLITSAGLGTAAPQGKYLTSRETATGESLWINRVGGHSRKLLARSGREISGMFAPGGRRVAVTMWNRKSDRTSISILEVSDGDRRRLAIVDGYASPARWSPDGSHLSFEAWRDDSALKVVSVTSGEVMTVTPGYRGASYYDWSPDSERLVFEVAGDDGDSEIAVARHDGSEMTVLTDTRWYNSDPNWSPDGSTILFESARDDTNPPQTGMAYTSELYAMDTDGSNQRRLLRLRSSYERELIWSPNGRRIAFMRQWDDELAPGKSPEVFTYSLSTERLRRLTRNRRWDVPRLWTPDGRWVIFARDLPKETEYFAQRPESKRTVQLTKSGISDHLNDFLQSTGNNPRS